MAVRPIDASGFERELIADMSLYGEKISGDEAYSRALLLLAGAPTLTPPNEPLKWDEFEALIDKPVYIVELERPKRRYWALVYQVSDAGVMLTSAVDLNDYGSRGLYGQSWLAYRRPPEGEEDT